MLEVGARCVGVVVEQAKVALPGCAVKRVVDVVETALLALAPSFVHVATVVTSVEPAAPVFVISCIGTKDEQNAEALSAINIALQASTSLRASS